MNRGRATLTAENAEHAERLFLCDLGTVRGSTSEYVT